MGARGYSFGSYELLARLPSGAPTQTFLARQRGADSFKKLVCLRTLLPDHAKSESVVELFLSEARVAAHLNHPACVTIYDLGRERGAYFISMEYVIGETLSNLIDASVDADLPLPAPIMASILASICDGLHYAHELLDPQGRPQNVIHGDISPRNIMITYEGHPKLLDFGISRTKSEHRKIRYAAPEEQQGQARDRKSDIYSLGLVMYEIFAARALGGTGADDRTDLVVGASRPPRLSAIVPDLDRDLEAISEKALAANPTSRFATAEELGEALRSYAAKAGFGDRRSSISKMMGEHFGERIALRARTLEKLLRGDCDERELEAALGARSVAELGYFFEAARGFRFEEITTQGVDKKHDTQVVGREQILEEHTDVVDPLPGGPDTTGGTSNPWVEATEHDDPDRSFPFSSAARVWADPTEIEPSAGGSMRSDIFIYGQVPNSALSDVGAIVERLSRDLAAGLRPQGADLDAGDSEHGDGDAGGENPTIPRLRIEEEDTTADDPKLVARALSVLGELQASQLPPIAEEPEIPTSERMMPKPALPLVVDPPRPNIAALAEKLAGDLETATGTPPIPPASTTQIGLPPPPPPPSSPGSGIGPATPIAPLAPLSSPAALSPPPGLSETPLVTPVMERPVRDPNVAYVSRSAAIKLMIVGISLGLVLGILLAVYVFTGTLRAPH